MSTPTNNSGDHGFIFDIQGHAVHDGPGSRTTVFLGGCPLQCQWCANPEGLIMKEQRLFRQSRCERCGSCHSECPHGAIEHDDEGKPRFDETACAHCTDFSCTKKCYSEALITSGRWIHLDELMHILERNRPFWGKKGGVTFSGGEPFLQSLFLKNALTACKKRGIHTCIETCGHVAADTFTQMLPLLDWVFIDLKHMSALKHRELTGADNQLILHNIRTLGSAPWSGFPVVRVPLVPTLNDDEEHMQQLAAYVKSCHIELINLLPYHRLGLSKYQQLGLPYRPQHVTPPGPALVQKCKEIIESYGLVCAVGDDTFF